MHFLDPNFLRRLPTCNISFLYTKQLVYPTKPTESKANTLVLVLSIRAVTDTGKAEERGERKERREETEKRKRTGKKDDSVFPKVFYLSLCRGFP